VFALLLLLSQGQRSAAPACLPANVNDVRAAATMHGGQWWVGLWCCEQG
jgi:hypothetical protein